MTHRRGWVAVLIFTAVVINYIDRITLSVAAKPIAAEFGFTPVQMGFLFSGFLWTYVVCLIPLGMAVERVGAKAMVGTGIAVWSLATALTAAGWGFGSLFACRLVMGASEATTYPAASRVIRDWFPERERGLVTTLFNGGSSAGPALGAVLTGALVTWFGWRTCFVALGALGFVWLAAWMIFYGSPERASWLPATERSWLLAGRGGAGPGDAHRPPEPSALGHLLRQRTVWGLVATQACLVYTAYLLLTWLPSYLQSTRDLSTMGTGSLTAVPYVGTIVLSLGIARLSDRMLSVRQIREGRRRAFVAAMQVMALAILLAPACTSMAWLLVVLTLTLTGSTTGAGLNFTLASDLLGNPRDVSLVTAITALGGNLFGLLAPVVTGYIVSATGGYDGAFRVAAALLCCGTAATMWLTREPIKPQRS